MRGPYQATQLVSELIATGIEAELRSIEREESFPQGSLGVPGLVTATDPGDVPIEKYPAVVVSTSTTPSAVLSDSEPGEEEWEVTYTIEAEVRVTHPNPETTDALRYAWLLAVRQCVLSNRQLDGAAIGSSFAEAYDAVGGDGRGRFYSAALIRFPLTVTETLVKGSTTRAGAVDITGYWVGPRDTLHVPPTPQP